MKDTTLFWRISQIMWDMRHLLPFSCFSLSFFFFLFWRISQIMWDMRPLLPFSCFSFSFFFLQRRKSRVGKTFLSFSFFLLFFFSAFLVLYSSYRCLTYVSRNTSRRYNVFVCFCPLLFFFSAVVFFCFSFSVFFLQMSDVCLTQHVAWVKRLCTNNNKEPCNIHITWL